MVDEQPVERYTLPTDTQHVSIEGRQYKIFNIDLAEGISRTKLVLGASVVVPWIALLSLFGVPFLSRGIFAYLAPPVVFLIFAFKTDEGGRPRYALWLDRLRFARRRRRPLVEKPGGGKGVADPFIARGAWVVLDARSIANRVNNDRRTERGTSKKVKTRA